MLRHLLLPLVIVPCHAPTTHVDDSIVCRVGYSRVSRNSGRSLGYCARQRRHLLHCFTDTAARGQTRAVLRWNSGHGTLLPSLLCLFCKSSRAQLILYSLRLSCLDKYELLCPVDHRGQLRMVTLISRPSMPARTSTLTGPAFQPDAKSIVSTWSGQTTKYLTLVILTIENSRNQAPWLPVLTAVVSVRQRLQLISHELAKRNSW